MRYFVCVCMAGAIAGAASFCQPAPAQDHHGERAGHRHDAGTAQAGDHHHHHRHGGANDAGFFGNLSPCWGGLGFGSSYSQTTYWGGGPLVVGGWYDPWYGSPRYGSPWIGGGWGGPIVYPPLVVPAESMFGVQPLMRFAGVGAASSGANLTLPAQIVRRAANARKNADPADGLWGQANGAARAKPAVRVSNRAARARAAQAIAGGDADFSLQKLSSALEKYKRAARLAPDLGESRMRLGFTYLALRKFKPAFAALRRGLELESDWPRQGFRLRVLYGPSKLADAAHLDALAKAALDAPQDATLLFLLGVRLYADGQRKRSTRFFEQANLLSVDEAPHIDLFLRELKRERDEAAGKREL